MCACLTVAAAMFRLVSESCKSHINIFMMCLGAKSHVALHCCMSSLKRLEIFPIKLQVMSCKEAPLASEASLLVTRASGIAIRNKCITSKKLLVATSRRTSLLVQANKRIDLGPKYSKTDLQGFERKCFLLKPR